MKYIFLSCFFSFFLPLAYGQNSYVPYSQTLEEGSNEIEFTSELFQTASIVDVDGENFALAEGVSHSKLDLDLYASYGFTSRLQGSVGARLRYITSQYIDSDDQEQSLIKSGVESGFIGFKYSFKPEDGVQYAFHGGYRKPLYTNDILETGETADNIALGDDGRDLYAGLSINNQTNDNNFLGMKLFYRSPSDVVSGEILSRFEYILVWNKFAMGPTFEYLYSLGADTYTEDPENKPRVFQGASNQFNSINRSWSAPGLRMNFTLGKTWRVETSYEQVISGTSTDLGPKYKISLVRRSVSKSKFEQKNANFKEYTVEAVVKKVSSTRVSVLIDKGLSAGLEVGSPIDFYYFDFLGGNELIAAGQVVKLEASKAQVKILKRYSKKRVEEGTVARGGQVN